MRSNFSIVLFPRGDADLLEPAFGFRLLVADSKFVIVGFLVVDCLNIADAQKFLLDDFCSALDTNDSRTVLGFEYEWHDDSGQWYRACGNEMWEFNKNGLIKRRYVSINGILIKESERKFLWARSA